MASGLQGKKIQQLVDEGILPNKINAIPEPGRSGREAFEATIKSTDAYAKYFSMLIKAELKGSEKQISWAKQIREEKAKSKAFEMVIRLLLTKIDPRDDTNFNTYGHRIIKEFTNQSAAWWIENRF